MPATNQLPVIVDLTSHITYPEDEDTLTLQASGTLTWLRDNLYLRFSESTLVDGQTISTKVMIKFESDGSIQIRRTSPTSTSQMHFINGHTSQTHYQTPAGMLLLSVDTESLKTDLDPKRPQQGQLDLVYSLSQNDLVVGHYHIQLAFRAN